MNVLAALSGGVDSAVAAALMKGEGHRVTGVTMSVWREGRYRGGGKNACFGPGERDDIEAARAICRLLDIPHLVVDCSEAYERVVVEYFRREYLAGRTPNPCVRCNSLIKFGLLPRLAEEGGARFDRFVTGHYARLASEPGRVRMFAARDPARDQSYFLYRLRQDQLERMATPLGEFGKERVRELARGLRLPVHDKPDSQDFYAGDRREILEVEDRPGAIVHVSGRVLGKHDGCWNFTIGQRRGLGVSHPEPLYVVDIDPVRNEVVVGGAEAAVRHALTAAEANWLSIPPPDAPFQAGVKVRSAGRALPCRVSPLPRGEFRVEFPGGIPGVAPGQSAVLYRDDMLLGGGIIASAE